MGFGSYDESDQGGDDVEINEDDQVSRPDEADAEGEVAFENGSVEDQLAAFRAAKNDEPLPGPRGPDEAEEQEAEEDRLTDALDSDEASAREPESRTAERGDSLVDEVAADRGPEFEDLADRDGVGEAVVDRLRDRFEDVDALAEADAETLTDVRGVGPAKAKTIAATLGAGDESAGMERTR